MHPRTLPTNADVAPWPRLAFSPRKAQFGSGSMDIDMDVLAEMARRSWALMAARYP